MATFSSMSPPRPNKRFKKTGAQGTYCLNNDGETGKKIFYTRREFDRELEFYKNIEETNHVPKFYENDNENKTITIEHMPRYPTEIEIQKLKPDLIMWLNSIWEQKGITHGDIRSENVMIRINEYGEKVLVLIDWGTAKFDYCEESHNEDLKNLENLEIFDDSIVKIFDDNSVELKRKQKIEERKRKKQEERKIKPIRMKPLF